MQLLLCVAEAVQQCFHYIKTAFVGRATAFATRMSVRMYLCHTGESRLHHKRFTVSKYNIHCVPEKRTTLL